MIRWLMPVLAGVLLGGIVHVASLLGVPLLAQADAYARLKPLGPANAFHPIVETGKDAPLPGQDPAFETLACVFDVSEGPVRIHVPVGPDYMALSFYSRPAIAFFSLNDRSALAGMIDVELRGPDASGAPVDQRPDIIVINAPDTTGFVLLRAFVPAPSYRGVVDAMLKNSRCERAPT